jgi:hypothetical protein
MRINGSLITFPVAGVHCGMRDLHERVNFAAMQNHVALHKNLRYIMAIK